MDRAVLVVEDEPVSALALVEALRTAGYRCGHANTVRQAMAMANQKKFAAAILDVNLQGSLVYPVADFLKAAGIPFLFTTAEFSQHPVLTKPCRVADVLRILTEIIEAQAKRNQATAAGAADAATENANGQDLPLRR